MSTKLSLSPVPSELQAAHRQFEQWLRTRQPGARIPASLWASARRLGVYRTARLLHLESQKLKHLVTAASPASRVPAAPTFVELLAPPAAGSGERTIEVEGPRGGRLRGPAPRRACSRSGRVEPRRLREAPHDEGQINARTGIFTSGIVATGTGHKIALFFTGRKHSGENLAAVLAHRAAELGPPIQVCDALTRNLPKPLAVLLANCLAHGRRQSVEAAPNFPDACRHVLEALSAVYRVDVLAREQALSPDDRLRLHQAHSGPVMTALHA